MEQYQIDDLKSNLQNYLESQGINTRKHFKCINPKHIEQNASMKYFNDNKVYCFGCGMTYNLFDVISILESCNNKEAFKRAINYYGYGHLPQKTTINKDIVIDKNNAKNYEKAYNFWQKTLKNNSEAKNYLKNRGIDMQTAERFQIGFNTFKFKGFELSAIVIPTSKNSFTARNIYDGDIRYYKTKNCHTKLFNTNALTNEKPYCVITEGEFDCLSFETLGINCVGLCSANNISKFFDCDKSKDKTYILALDNDHAGKQATDEIIKYFRENNILYTTFDNCGYKDANEALTKDKTKFSKSIKQIVETLTDAEYSSKNIAEM